MTDVAAELGDDKAGKDECHAEEFVSFWAFVEVEGGEADEDDQGDGFTLDCGGSTIARRVRWWRWRR